MISFTTGVFAEQTVQAFNLDNKVAQFTVPPLFQVVSVWSINLLNLQTSQGRIDFDDFFIRY